MKLTAISFLLLILLISNVGAIRINEVEANPAGTDAGNEWIELYNDGEISLEGYSIVNNDGDNISLNGGFMGYFIYVFTKQWLDNSNESIRLYKDFEMIDETEIFADSSNNGFTWQFCEGSWEFLNSTRGQENNCPIVEEAPENNESIGENTTTSNMSQEDNSTNAVATDSSSEANDPQNITSASDFVSATSKTVKTGEKGDEKIYLNKMAQSTKDEKEMFITKEEKIRLYAAYSFTFLAIVIIILLLLKKKEPVNL